MSAIKLMDLFAQAANGLFPQHCCLCNKVIHFKEMLCGDCYQNLPWNRSACRQCALPLEQGSICGICTTAPPAFIRSIAAFRYQRPISHFIMQLKFQQQLRYSKMLSQLLGAAIIQFREEKNIIPLPQCLIPVPLHNRRLRERGFNQALEIAKGLSNRFNIPLLRDSCIRRKPTLPQSQLSANARRRNLQAAFAIKKAITFKHVAIVDDVVTTSQTVRALSQLLSQHGVETIEVWCCARA